MEKIIRPIKEIVWNLFFRNDIVFVQNHYVPAQQLQLIAELETTLDMVKQLQKNSEEENKELEKYITELEEKIRVLKNEERTVTKPEWLKYASVFIPKVIVPSKYGDRTVSIQPNDIYTSSNRIRNIVAQNKWKKLYMSDKKACAYEIWKYVIKAIKYELDKSEDWRYSPTTLAYEKGDCEDGTILFLDLAKEAGFKADEVFNGLGWVKTNSGNFGHSFPILNYGEGWFIYETTIDYVPSSPMKFDGSNYDASFGVVNWRFAGKINNSKQQI